MKIYSQQTTSQIDKTKNKKNKKEFTNVLSIIRDPYFWKNMITATRILTLIYKIQYLSKINNYSLHRIINNWILIKQFLIKSIIEHNTKHCYLSHIINKVWDDRYLTQIIILHVIASLLIPENHVIKSMNQSIEVTFDHIIIEFFIRYALSNQVTTYMRDFWAFRTQTGVFFPHENFV